MTLDAPVQKRSALPAARPQNKERNPSRVDPTTEDAKEEVEGWMEYGMAWHCVAWQGKSTEYAGSFERYNT